MDAEITVIGAGVVGLAIAAEVSKHYSPVLVVERHKTFGQETSSRNSEVIHSGIYYPANSLKARLCITGKEKLYDYCEKKHLSYSKCGKLIVAKDPGQEPEIQKILATAFESGVRDARQINRDELHELEPHVQGSVAAWFPSTGIVDSHGLMAALESDIRMNGGDIAYAHEVTSIERIEGGYGIGLLYDLKETFRMTSRRVVNAAGLFADRVAKLAGASRDGYTQHFWKGEYFTLIHGKGRKIHRLVYQLPERNTVGLGIHTTPDLQGRIRLGPNTIYLKEKKPDYSVDPAHARDFADSVSGFLPFVTPGDLTPDQAGIRPKLQGPGEPWRDFIIREESSIGFHGFVNLLGIESPGLTASLAIAEFVSHLIDAKK